MPANKYFFSRFINPVFIETGTFRGDGLVAAVEAGFTKLYSIDMVDYWFKNALWIFRGFDNIILIKGDSGVELVNILKEIGVPCTFWLDAHYSEQNTYEGPSPLFKELKAISDHKIKMHTILIDDISDYDIEMVKAMMPGYNFSIENNILICLP